MSVTGTGIVIGTGTDANLEMDTKTVALTGTNILTEMGTETKT